MHDQKRFSLKMPLKIKILTALDAVIDYINITDKTDYYVKSSLMTGTGHPNVN